MIRVVGKVLLLAGVLTAFLTRTALGRRDRATRVKRMHRSARQCLNVLGIRVKGSLENGPGGCLVVANHMSYIDIVVLAALRPVVFLPSVEVGENGFQGLMARAGGSVFVERRHAFSLPSHIRAVSDLLKQGFSIVLFAEGTTSDGQSVLPFRPGLFECAVRTGGPVLPVCVRYLCVNGQPIDRSGREAVGYYGDMTFFKQVGRLLRLQSVNVDVTCAPPIPSAGRTRREMALLTRSAIVAVHGS